MGKEAIKKEKKTEKKTERLKIGLLYLGLHNQLIKKYGPGEIITRKEFLVKIGKHYQLPKELRPWLIKEMQKANLIHKINRDQIKLIPYEINIEEDSHELINRYFGEYLEKY